MESTLRVLLVDAGTAFYRVNRYKVGEFFGPVDLGLHLSGRHNSLNFGTGLFCGSIFPGSNRMIFSGFSPSWGGFYISSMGGAGLVFDNLGINMVSLVGKAATPSVLVLNRVHGEEVQVSVHPVDVQKIWGEGRGGVYSLMDYVFERWGGEYPSDPRILTAGPAALYTDSGGICSVPIRKGELTFVDTWAGRGGLGSKMAREHGIVAVIYGGSYVDEDFRNRTVADEWFQGRFKMRMAAKDMEATTKYRFDPKFGTGGTFGVNYTTLKGRMLSFNYRSIFWSEPERLALHKRLVVDHYLKQFNEETIEPKQQKNCGEPCAAVCKKLNGPYKKDYEPYQTMGPLCGVFDQRAAELLNHHADMLGYDAISIGGVLSWLMECLVEGILTPEECGVTALPRWDVENFDVVEDSMHNARIGVALLDALTSEHPVLDLSEGARKLGRHLSREKGMKVLDPFVYVAFGRKGWMVPNQYWASGPLSPMAIMGKYYMHYGSDFIPPRLLGNMNAERFKHELVLDNLGICRFHRGWAEELGPQFVGELFGVKDAFMERISKTATRINSRNASVFWESERNMDFIFAFLKRHRDVEGNTSEELAHWIARFEENKREAALEFWYEIHKGIHEKLAEFL